MSKRVIRADSPDEESHLRPVLEYLFSKGNRPKYGKDQYVDGKGMRLYYCAKKIDWIALGEKFNFPESITLHPEKGIIYDRRNAIQIVQGIEAI